jgi:hypothetical protein
MVEATPLNPQRVFHELSPRLPRTTTIATIPARRCSGSRGTS